MTVEIKVPALGESVTEATVGSWKKKEGEFAKAGELLVELETDKVTLEVTAPSDGVIEKISAPQGTVVAIGTVLGSMKAGGAPSINNAMPAPTAQANSSAPANNDAMFPSVRKIAAENNLDLSSIAGSGKNGMVTKGDALEAMASGGAVKSSGSCGAILSEKQEERVKMTKLRQTIAKRLKDSQNTAAILTTFNEIDMSKVIKIRNEYKDQFEKKYGVKLGFMSFFVKAAVAALKEIPAVNGSIEDDYIIYKNYYDIGVAVGTEQGLVVPIVRDADKKSFAQIEKDIVDYGKKAREGKLSIADMTGGTFTISNGGVYGSLLSTPIINPPQSGILGMHKTQDRPVAVDGKVEIRPMMYIALSYDHRIIDGKEAVTFLVKIKEALEDPARMLFEV
jgi:2-oxoglutarate dehydrogenase E2 component (dihydrolipoamide succinyltransferase)